MVVDTGIFVEHLRTTNKATTTLQKLPDQGMLFISSITLYELFMGATTQAKWVDVNHYREYYRTVP